jgi:hypothetical protein
MASTCVYNEGAKLSVLIMLGFLVCIAVCEPVSENLMSFPSLFQGVQELYSYLQTNVKAARIFPENFSGEVMDLGLDDYSAFSDDKGFSGNAKDTSKKTGTDENVHIGSDFKKTATVGTLVEIHSLSGETHYTQYNGKQARIVRFVEDTGRVGVRLEGSRRILSLEPQNMRVLNWPMPATTAWIQDHMNSLRETDGAYKQAFESVSDVVRSLARKVILFHDQGGFESTELLALGAMATVVSYGLLLISRLLISNFDCILKTVGLNKGLEGEMVAAKPQSKAMPGRGKIPKDVSISHL